MIRDLVVNRKFYRCTVVNMGNLSAKIVQMKQLNQFLAEQHPVIAWDWDQTLSANGVMTLPVYREIMKKLTAHYGFKHIIVSGRIMKFSPLGFEGEPFEISVFFNTENVNIYRWKLWILRFLYKNGKGILRLYVDNNSELVEVLRKEKIPAILAHKQHYQWFIDNLQKFRELEGKDRILQHQG